MIEINFSPTNSNLIGGDRNIQMNVPKADQEESVIGMLFFLVLLFVPLLISGYIKNNFYSAGINDHHELTPIILSCFLCLIFTIILSAVLIILLV